jgi:hypothetical protein
VQIREWPAHICFIVDFMPRTSPRHSTGKASRKPLTREMLLPLPAATVRKTSLENHLALVAMRTGNGSVDQMSCLLKATYLAWFLLDTAAERERHIHLLRSSEAALHQSGIRAQSGQSWSLGQEEIADLEGVLALHDRQLQSICAYQYHGAWDRLNRYVASDANSPLPPRRML